MSQACSDKSRLSPLDVLVLVSIVLGPAASYSIVYLFHIAMGAKLVSGATSLPSLRDILSRVRLIPYDIVFLGLFLGWYALSILWAENETYALAYCAYIVMGMSIVVFLFQISSNAARMKAALGILAMAFSAELLIAVLEGLRLVRLPMSPYSPLRWLFGRAPSDLSSFSPEQVDYILALPTGFLGNPNTLSATLILVLPFFLLSPRRGWGTLGAAAILFVIFMAGSRLALIGYVIAVFAAVIVYGTMRGRLALLAATILIVSLNGPIIDTLISSPNARVAGIGQLGVLTRDVAVGLASRLAGSAGTETGSAGSDILLDLLFGSDSDVALSARVAFDGQELEQQNIGSTGSRALLMRNGFRALLDSNGLGVGAGGSRTVQENAGKVNGRLTSMHNFWVEILVDGGVFAAVLFGSWYLITIGRLWWVSRRSGEKNIRYVSAALCISLGAFTVAAVGASSVIYLLPMWLAIGGSISVIALHKASREVTESVDASHETAQAL